MFTRSIMIMIFNFWSMFAGANSRGSMKVRLVLFVTELFRPYNEAVIFVNIITTRPQVGIRTLTLTYVHIVAT